ncbi:MAG: SPOR domain-containing protein [Proteobacteria bacterium]|nr:SPOR domain-containing protein [Pseudomonadota bacterium]
MTYRNKQAGGTILGIIIGLIIGLGIAVAVAIKINNTPVPFINRAKVEKPAEPTASAPVDLNKSLYGNREPAKEAAKEFVKEPVPAADANKPADDKDAAKAKDKKSDDDKNAGKDAAKPAASEDKWTYYLQAGAFREQAEAENAKAKLALLGFETRISERSSDNGTLYRVRVGPFSEVEAMNKMRTKLSDNGVDVSVVRIQK